MDSRIAQQLTMRKTACRLERMDRGSSANRKVFVHRPVTTRRIQRSNPGDVRLKRLGGVPEIDRAARSARTPVCCGKIATGEVPFRHPDCRVRATARLPIARKRGATSQLIPPAARYWPARRPVRGAVPTNPAPVAGSTTDRAWCSAAGPASAPWQR